MESILNMEYSLRAILYLVELQIKEGLMSKFIHYIETYPINLAEYKKEVLEYLSKHNTDTLKKTLSKQVKICNIILEKWNNELRLMNRGSKEAIRYDIYCIFKKDAESPFENIELIRNRKGVYEYGNRYKENDRFWIELDITNLQEKYKTKEM